MRIFTAVSCLFTCGGLFAAAPTVSVSSSEPFRLRGAEVVVAGVPSWPVFDGDEVGAEKGPATLKLSCGSRVQLNAGTVAVVTFEAANFVVHISSGAAVYKIAKGCPVLFEGTDGAPVAATQIAGTASLVHKAIVFGFLPAGAAAGISEAILAEKPPPVSPSR
ncbi:MAG TPA: hypothetical protein VKU01_32655 [Bryobacteraceae bacterium]|nr:hypothetical protein [Bryobacteraceae bacterium]